MRTFLVGFAFAFLSSLASASCYVGGGAAQSRVDRIPTGRNDNLLASEYVDGTYTADHTGRLHEMVFGCSLPYDSAVEVGYMTGTVAAVDTDARIVHPDVNGSIPFSISERVDVRMVSVSAVKYATISGPFAVFGRLGIVHTQAEIVSSMPLGNGYSLQYLDTRTMTSPYVGIGAALRMKGSLNLRVEQRLFAKGVGMTSITAVYPF